MFGFTSNAKIAAQYAAILSQGEKLMSGLTDLQTAVATLTTAVTAAAASFSSLSAQISAANAATGDPDATIETLAQQVGAQATALTAAIPPAAAAAS